MRKVILIAVVLGAGIIGWLYWQQTRPEPLIVSGFVEADEIRVGSQIGGRIAEVFASEGQRLKTGAPLYRLDPFDLNETLAQAQAELASYRAELALLEEGTRKEDIAEAKAALAEAVEALKLAEQGYRAEDIAKAAAQVAAAQAQVAAIKTRMNELAIAAPCDCVVEAIDLRPGDLVAPNAPSASVLDLSRMWVRACVPESRLGQIRLDQRVPIRADSFPDERFPGRITFIAQEAEFTPRNIQTPEERSKQVFRIKVTLEKGLDRLRVGMAADVLLNEAN
jgi:HlyD family secretion protein